MMCLKFSEELECKTVSTLIKLCEVVDFKKYMYETIFMDKDSEISHQIISD